MSRSTSTSSGHACQHLPFFFAALLFSALHASIRHSAESEVLLVLPGQALVLYTLVEASRLSLRRPAARL